MNLFNNFAFCPKFLPNIPQKEKHQKTKIHAWIFSMILLLAPKQYVQNIHIHAKNRKNTQTCAKYAKMRQKYVKICSKFKRSQKDIPNTWKCASIMQNRSKIQANAAQILHNLAKWSQYAPPTLLRPSKMASKLIKKRGFMAWIFFGRGKAKIHGMNLFFLKEKNAPRVARKGVACQNLSQNPSQIHQFCH